MFFLVQRQTTHFRSVYSHTIYDWTVVVLYYPQCEEEGLAYLKRFTEERQSPDESLHFILANSSKIQIMCNRDTFRWTHWCMSNLQKITLLFFSDNRTFARSSRSMCVLALLCTLCCNELYTTNGDSSAVCAFCSSINSIVNERCELEFASIDMIICSEWAVGQCNSVLLI